MYNELNIFKALGEETKHKILELLLDNELCACEIPKKINRTQSNTSMHLSKLTNWEIIESRREGKKIIYSVKNPKIKEIFRIIKKGDKK